MKRSKKVTIGIIIFFIIVATVIGGRTAMGVYFKNKFSKRQNPTLDPYSKSVSAAKSRVP